MFETIASKTAQVVLLSPSQHVVHVKIPWHSHGLARQESAAAAEAMPSTLIQLSANHATARERNAWVQTRHSEPNVSTAHGLPKSSVSAVMDTTLIQMRHSAAHVVIPVGPVQVPVVPND